MLERIYTPMFMSSIFRKINAVDKKKIIRTKRCKRHILGATNIGCPSFRIDHS
jgi:hypothetical protein